MLTSPALVIVGNGKTKLNILCGISGTSPYYDFKPETFEAEWAEVIKKGTNTVMFVDPKHDLRGIDTRAPDPKVGIAVFILEDPKDEVQYAHWAGRACRYRDVGTVLTYTSMKGHTKKLH